MMIVNEQQASRLANLLEWECGEFHHIEIHNPLVNGGDGDGIHIKEYGLDGQVRNYYIDAQGELIIGAVGMWGIVNAASPDGDAR